MLHSNNRQDDLEVGSALSQADHVIMRSQEGQHDAEAGMPVPPKSRRVGKMARKMPVRLLAKCPAPLALSMACRPHRRCD